MKKSLLCALAFSASSAFATSQDAVEERLSSLETRVAFLEQFLSTPPTSGPCAQTASGTTVGRSSYSAVLRSGQWSRGNSAYIASLEFSILKRTPLTNGDAILTVKFLNRISNECVVDNYFASDVVLY